MNDRDPKAPGLYVVAAPSGGGKTSLVNALLKRDERVALSISHTTRAPRPGERDGVHYHFVDEAGFTELAERGAFLEHARVFDHRYGTGRDQSSDIWPPATTCCSTSTGRAPGRSAPPFPPCGRFSSCRRPWPSCAGGWSTAARTAMK